MEGFENGLGGFEDGLGGFEGSEKILYADAGTGEGINFSIFILNDSFLKSRKGRQRTTTLCIILNSLEFTTLLHVI